MYVYIHRVKICNNLGGLVIKVRIFYKKTRADMKSFLRLKDLLKFFC
jgi:hypothetical protein